MAEELPVYVQYGLVIAEDVSQTVKYTVVLFGHLLQPKSQTLPVELRHLYILRLPRYAWRQRIFLTNGHRQTINSQIYKIRMKKPNGHDEALGLNKICVYAIYFNI